MVGVRYTQPLVATGGKLPYHWAVAAGQLPTGLQLDATSGMVSGTPIASGNFAPTVAVTDAADQDATKTLPATVIPAAPSAPVAAPLAISSAATLSATLNTPFSATASASGGAAPYSWSIASGTLPAGLQFDASTGAISGTPSAAGSASLTLAVSDSTQATASQALTISVSALGLDAYGGMTALPCPSASSTGHFYAARVGQRWHLCTPAGNAFWMNSVYNVDATDSSINAQGFALNALVAAKYASGVTSNPTLNWALQSVRRLQAWGFNSLAEYAVNWTWPVRTDPDWGTADDTIPVKLPFVVFEGPSHYSLTNSGNLAQQPVKDLIIGVKSSVYSGYRSQTPDIFDPNWSLWFTNSLAQDSSLQAALHGPHSDYLIGINVDDTDYLEGFGAGADFPTVANGVVNKGYSQPHLGWIVLVTAPTQSSNSAVGEQYSDTTVYAKQALASWLAARYGNSIAALDQAWGASYTSFGSSHASGAAWGTGTGLLDEDGGCPAAHGGACWVPSDPYALQGATAAMRQDLDDFLLFYAQHYFATIKAALASAAPGVMYFGPTSIGTWGTPPRRQILQAAGASLDALMVASLPPDCANCTDIQQRLDFVSQYGGDKPWISWEGYQAKADSEMAANASSADELQTQEARGQLYAKRLQQLAAAADSSGVQHLVGLKWWAMYDSRGEGANWGLLTLRDDPYDGVASTAAAGKDQWGYPTGCLPVFGCEPAHYGDFLDSVARANLALIQQLAAGN